MRREKALILRQLIIQASASLGDNDASLGIELFPTMKYDGELIKANTRIRWGNELKRAMVDLWDTEPNNPNNAPAIWETVLYRDGIRIIPENIPAIDPFYYGDFGWWGDDLYESIFEGANVYTPEQYAPNWRLVNVND